MTQLDMFDSATRHAPKQAAKIAKRVAILQRPSIEQRFADFHRDNPHVLVEMRRCALERIAHGNKRISAKALWEELRESIRLKKLGNWKLDNSLTALFARALIAAEPALAGVIELRQRKAP